MNTHISWDYSQFDPNANNYSTYLPPEGDYPLSIERVASKHNDATGIIIEVEYLAKGDEKTFVLGNMVQHSNPDTRRIAAETLGKLYFAVTGEKPPATGFDALKLQGGKIHAEVKHTHKDGKVYGSLRNIRAFVQQQPQQAQQPVVQQGSVYGKPSW